MPAGAARGQPTARASAGRLASGRPRAPFGRRLLTVTAVEELGAYRVLRVADPDAGPGARAPGQFAMLAAAERWGGGEDERPYLAARVLDRPRQRRRGPLPARGRRPGHAGGCASSGPASGCGCSDRSGRASRAPREGPAGATRRRRRRDRAAGDLQDELAREGSRRRRCSASATRARAQGAALLRGAQLATDDGSAGHHGLVTELLVERARRRRGRRPSTPAGLRRCWRRVRAICRALRRPGAARAGGGNGLRLRRLLRLRRAAARRRLPAGVRRRPGDRCRGARAGRGHAGAPA